MLFEHSIQVCVELWILKHLGELVHVISNVRLIQIRKAAEQSRNVDAVDRPIRHGFQTIKSSTVGMGTASRPTLTDWARSSASRSKGNAPRERSTSVPLL
jgi:hypothetical protein